MVSRKVNELRLEVEKVLSFGRVERWEKGWRCWD